MCLILLGWRVHDDCPVVIAANRDEFHDRPAARAAFWEDRPGMLGGRDLRAGGTWLGVSREGRFAVVTNYRGGTEPSAEESRGALVTRYLEGIPVPELAQRKDAYSGFNLLAGDGGELWWLSNRDGAARRLAPGWYGLGNLLLDSPEVEPHKARFRQCPPSFEPLFRVLECARIVDERYGTRCSSVLLAGAEIRYAERSFGSDGSDQGTLRYEFRPRRIS
jgi:uncharacterized protein with NRDE domain